MLAIYSHGDCARHDPVPDHPEQPARLAAALAAFDDEALIGCPREQAPLATREQLLLAHTSAHIDRIFAAGASDRCVSLDPDTAMAPDSLEAALRAAGAVVAAVDAVITGRFQRAFCAVRPPGHHATGDLAMGFCLFNNVAVGALHAVRRHGLARVAVIDFDVHHGNGSQAIFWNTPQVLFASSHQWPLYPGSGRTGETGASDNIVNLPLPTGTGSADFRQGWRESLVPRIDAFQPELLLISAGFDAHHDDPLAGLALTTDDYGWITGELVDIANRHASGRMVSTLEGGYDLAALTASVRAHALALLCEG